ncbi:MAG: S41 family peptidase [Planctomycetota bacterium]|jgi:hypothetical protein
MRVTGWALGCLLAGTVLAKGSSKYLEDFEFIRDTVRLHGAAVKIKSKRIDWKAACARLRPLFKDCKDDVEHVKNCKRLLAVLHDSHTGVTRHSADAKRVPSKWDGLYGGGLWIGWDRGLLFVQGLMKGHSLTGAVPQGSVLCTIGGEPAWLVMEREKRRITKYAGSSSDHSLFCPLDNRLLPFGHHSSIEIVFLTPEGKTKKTSVARWGPGGKAFYPSTATLPDGVKWAKGAVSTMLEVKWAKVGYLRITGGMDRETAREFHRACDRLEGMEALLLDCRRMGGGTDDCAWEMAGRFFPEGVSNGMHGRIAPAGRWQFDGPVVMLQDEVEISSAETFTWAMSETERCVSVGRPTGGWGIIPKGYSCPSGIVSFRLGVTDRPTPIRRIHTEGVGWPPDVLVPYGPVLCARPDPVFEVGVEVLRTLHAGESRKKTIAAFHAIFHGKPDRKSKGPVRKLAKLGKEDLEQRLAMETRLLKLEKLGPVDALGVSRRLATLTPRAKAAGVKGPLTRLTKAVKSAKAEIAAQRAFLEMTDEAFQASDADKKRFLAKYKKTAIARFAKERFWR